MISEYGSIVPYDTNITLGQFLYFYSILQFLFLLFFSFHICSFLVFIFILQFFFVFLRFLFRFFTRFYFYSSSVSIFIIFPHWRLSASIVSISHLSYFIPPPTVSPISSSACFAPFFLLFLFVNAPLTSFFLSLTLLLSLYSHTISPDLSSFSFSPPLPFPLLNYISHFLYLSLTLFCSLYSLTLLLSWVRGSESV